MKAFEITWSGLPKERGVYAALSAGKAKYQCASVLVETGYAINKGVAFTQIKCRRRPDLDTWASQFNCTVGRTISVVCCDLCRGSHEQI